MMKTTYYVAMFVWNEKLEEYECKTIDFEEDYNKAQRCYESTPVNKDILQIELWQSEETRDWSESTLLRKAEYDPEEYEGRYELKPEEW